MFIGHLYIIFHQEPLKSFAHFPIGLFFSLFFKNYLLDFFVYSGYSLLVVISIVIILSHSVACCFALSMGSCTLFVMFLVC